jgi:hypothetical protein
MQKAFDQMKALMPAGVLCAYLDHNKPFHIFTDASDNQLGACLVQEGKPVAYYNKKLNSAQMNYATIDKELLCVVSTLCELRSMLLGAELQVHTDQETFGAFVTLHSNVFAGCPTLMNMDQNYIMWKAHAR